MPENIVWDKEINPDALVDDGGIKWDKTINSVVKEPTRLMIPITDNQVIRTADKPSRFGKFTQDIDDYLESNKVTSGVYGDIKNFFTKSKEEDVADAGIRLQIAEETGIPMQHVDKDVMRNYAEAQGAYTQPTNKQVMGGLMTASLAIPGAMIIKAPTMATKAAVALKTAVGVGTFAAIEEGINYLASTIKDKEYRFGAGESFAPEDSSQTVKDLFYVGELIAGGYAAGKAIGGAKYGAEKIKENFLRETVETYNMPRTIYISPEKIREFHGLGREDVISPAETAILKDMKLSREDYVSALKNGIDLELPVERIVTIADKPWVKGLKDWFRMAPYEKTTADLAAEVKAKQPVAGLLEEKGGLAGEAKAGSKTEGGVTELPMAVEKVEPSESLKGEISIDETVLGKSSYGTSIYKDGNLIADGTFTIGDDGVAKVGMIRAINGRDTIAPTEWKTILGQLKEKYPQIKKFDGDRVTRLTKPEPKVEPTANVEPLIEEAKKYKTAEEFVKAQGEPVYHGTTKQFDEFDMDLLGENTKAKSAKLGVFFTEDTSVAGRFAEGNEAMVKSARINIKNPLEFSTPLKMRKTQFGDNIPIKGEYGRETFLTKDGSLVDLEKLNRIGDSFE